MIPACLWFVRRNKSVRKKEILFIDARNMGEMISRRNRCLIHDEILKITDTYHAWLGEKTETPNFGQYKDELGFCKSVSLAEIEKQGYVLTPGRYVGIPEEVDDEDFDDKMKKLISDLKGQMAESRKLDEEIKKNLEGVGYE